MTQQQGGTLHADAALGEYPAGVLLFILTQALQTSLFPLGIFCDKQRYIQAGKKI
jgi:hypothetical protein